MHYSTSLLKVNLSNMNILLSFILTHKIEKGGILVLFQLMILERKKRVTDSKVHNNSQLVHWHYAQKHFSFKTEEVKLTTLPNACLDPKGLMASGMSRYVSVRALS